MTIELTILISFASVSFAIYAGLTNINRNKKKDNNDVTKEVKEETKEETTQNTIIVMKLENISNDLKEIKSEYKGLRAEIVAETKARNEENTQMRERVAIVEASLKSYHKRLDSEQKPN